MKAASEVEISVICPQNGHRCRMEEDIVQCVSCYCSNLKKYRALGNDFATRYRIDSAESEYIRS